MWFQNLAIRKKFIISFSLLLFLGFIGSIIGFNSFRKIDNFQHLRINTAELIHDLNLVQKKQKEFLLYAWKSPEFLKNGQSEATLQINKDLSLIIEELENQLNHKASIGESLSRSLVQLNSLVQSYQISFNRLTNLLYKRGFKNYGLEGQMRKYAHNLQERESVKEQVFALTLRKHEKDFALRNDLKYVENMESTLKDFKNFVQNASITEYPHLTDAYREKTIEEINAYAKHFKTIVQTELLIGLNQESGTLMELEHILEKTNPIVASIYQDIQNKNSELRHQATITLSITAIAMILGSLLLIYLLRKTVSKPIIKLDKIVSKVLKEDNDADNFLDIHSKDEIGSLSRNFKEMLAMLRHNYTMVKQTNESLQSKAEEDKLRSWSNEGLAKFSELMKHTDADVEQLAKELISNLVKYIHAKQGAMFLSETDQERNVEVLNLKASYAFGRNKYFRKTIDRGEGLVGQCWIEKEAIYLTDVPDNYLRIRSGLGDAAPRSILIVPVNYKNQVIGVIELASFNKFSQEQINFVKELSSRIGANFNAVKMQQVTNRLLEDSQKMTEQLRSQEEEMRQNMEELESTQEEMERNTRYISEKLNESVKQKNLLSQLITKLHGGVLIINERGEVVDINKKVMNHLALNENDLISKNISDIPELQVKDLLLHIENDPQFHASGFSESHQVKLLGQHGIYEPYYCLASRFYFEDEKYYCLLINKKKEDFSLV